MSLDLPITFHRLAKTTFKLLTATKCTCKGRNISQLSFGAYFCRFIMGSSIRSVFADCFECTVCVKARVLQSCVYFRTDSSVCEVQVVSTNVAVRYLRYLIAAGFKVRNVFFISISRFYDFNFKLINMDFSINTN